jgi:hypothetical protein
MNDDFSDEEMAERVPVTRTSEIARLLGRIEQTLIDMRRDIQAGTKAQGELATQLGKMDQRVLRLENKEADRTRYSRVMGVVMLAVLVPTANMIGTVHNWFNTVDKQCFPRGK